MRLDPVEPPREFATGADGTVVMRDTGSVSLEPDEQVTFTTPSGGEYDVARKEWGFYATPSLNGRLPRFGLRGVLVRNGAGHVFVLLVERGCEDSFAAYVASERLDVLGWLDDEDALRRIAEALA